PGLARDVREPPASQVVIEMPALEIVVGGRAGGRDTGVVAELKRAVVELHVGPDVEIKEAIAVRIEEDGAGIPPGDRPRAARPRPSEGNVGAGVAEPSSLVVEQGGAPVSGQRQIDPPVIVIITG